MTDSQEDEMAQFEAAHIREQGQDMIIIPLDHAFGQKTNDEQNRVRDSLQICARGAGLAGIVVPVWDAGGGRMGFLAPQPWRSFFAGMTLAVVAANINKTLTCS